MDDFKELILLIVVLIIIGVVITALKLVPIWVVGKFVTEIL